MATFHQLRISIMFLTDDDLRQLTGYLRAAPQKRWLLRLGIAFEENARGRPIVLRNLIEKRLGLHIDSPKKSKINLAALS